MATGVVQMDGMAGLGLKAPVPLSPSGIVAQPPLCVIQTRQVVMEPNNVGVPGSGGGGGGGETSVVF